MALIEEKRGFSALLLYPRIKIEKYEKIVDKAPKWAYTNQAAFRKRRPQKENFGNNEKSC
ncbi:hypothetical protein [Intestinibacillus sp. Marseille-P6563]|uniref:hypothetical protein n=1 Tax=Intestinibacillus sp. Marseille-P6563 TaxID=2364792 RepID=UPI0013DF680C|nr:hypothetical protein [Intestinibacillus sp. Marseille-P6563]